MKEILEILNAIKADGISDERLAEIRHTWIELGSLLDAAQSDDGVSTRVAVRAWLHVGKVEDLAR